MQTFEVGIGPSHEDICSSSEGIGVICFFLLRFHTTTYGMQSFIGQRFSSADSYHRVLLQLSCTKEKSASLFVFYSVGIVLNTCPSRRSLQSWSRGGAGGPAPRSVGICTPAHSVHTVHQTLINLQCCYGEENPRKSLRVNM